MQCQQELSLWHFFRASDQWSAPPNLIQESQTQGGPHLLSFTMGSDSRHLLQLERTVAPQLKPNKMWRYRQTCCSVLCLTGPPPSLKKGLHVTLSSPYTGLQRRCRPSSEKLSSSYKVTQLLSPRESSRFLMFHFQK